MQGPEVKEPATSGEDIAVAVTIQSQVNGRRTIIMQTYVGRDAPKAVFNELVDKLSGVIDRQEARFDLEGVKASLEADERGLLQAEESFKNVEVLNAERWAQSGKRGEARLSPAETQSKLNMATNIKAFRAAIEKKKAEMAELQREIDKVD